MRFVRCCCTVFFLYCFFFLLFQRFYKSSGMRERNKRVNVLCCRTSERCSVLMVVGSVSDKPVGSNGGVDASSRGVGCCAAFVVALAIYPPTHPNTLYILFLHFILSLPSRREDEGTRSPKQRRPTHTHTHKRERGDREPLDVPPHDRLHICSSSVP